VHDLDAESPRAVFLRFPDSKFTSTLYSHTGKAKVAMQCIFYHNPEVPIATPSMAITQAEA